jgi:hypothetical protein
MPALAKTVEPAMRKARKGVLPSSAHAGKGSVVEARFRRQTVSKGLFFNFPWTPVQASD